MWGGRHRRSDGAKIYVSDVCNGVVDFREKSKMEIEMSLG